jgi:hypothetical protein
MKFNKKIEKEVIFEIFLFFVAIFTVALLWRNNAILFIFLLIECAITMKLWHEKYDIVYFLVAAILGPLGEIICIYYGTWNYASPTLLGIPMWLPLVWGFTGIVLTRIARTILRMISK